MRILLFTLLCFTFAVQAQPTSKPTKPSAQTIKLTDLTCEHLTNPMSITEKQPRLSWKIATQKRNIRQVAYEIRVATSPDFSTKSIVWASPKIASDESVLQSCKGVLASRERYYWQVSVWTTDGQVSGWSPTAVFETGFFSNSEWEAKWIELASDTARGTPSVSVRKTFNLKKKVEQARAFVTAHGFYELYLNGKKVGDDVFTPGWTSYAKRLQYQVYDVTSMLAQGQNGVGAMLGDGYYRGTVGWASQWGYYGKKRGLLCQIHVKYSDGSEDIIASDSTWKGSQDGPIRENDLIYLGETYDARKSLGAWSEANFNDKFWLPVQVGDYSLDNLVASNSVPVKRIQEIKPTRIFRTPKGTLVADFGQNMVGWVRLKVAGSVGTTVTMRHAEVLDKSGEFYTENMRFAKVTATYILRGDAQAETYEPRFAYFGFRYVSIEGLPKSYELTSENLTGIVVHSAMKLTGDFSCSNPLINQLQHNIQWGQKGNFVDIPTDCPQRDERMGWTGDAQVFCRTAAFNRDVSTFFAKWLADLAADQRANGEVPYEIPDVLNPRNSLTVNTSAGWGDAATIVPWAMYQAYDDVKILENQYPSMKAWVEYIRKKSGEELIWRGGSRFGDWLSYMPHPDRASEPDGHTTKDYIATVFFAHSVKLTAQAADVLGKKEDVIFYNALFEKIKKAFQSEFVTPSGRTASDSQTSYVLALMFDLLPENLQTKAVNYLVEDIKNRKNHLSTGFLGTPYLCQVLSDNGRADVAYDLLLQETYPSWLYPVKMGATTIWERWDGIKVDSSFQDVGMNSFNHYAYGAVGDWLYRVVAGIEMGKTGYKHILIQPQPTPRLTFAKAYFESNYGLIESNWEQKDGKMRLEVRIPPNTMATIRLPNAKIGKITEGSSKVLNGEFFKNIRADGQAVKLETGSGFYVFEWVLE
jgi:alpha-L-rhamnosidase